MFVGEFGDFDPSDHEPGYLDEFPYLEDKVRMMTVAKSEFFGEMAVSESALSSSAVIRFQAEGD